MLDRFGDPLSGMQATQRYEACAHIKTQCATCQTGALLPAVAQPRTPSHVGAAPLDCSGSACHAPLGCIGARFGNWR